MNKVFNEWTIGECIGEGAFGKVYQITREDFGHIYYAALKVIEIPQSQSEVEGLRNDGMHETEIEEYFQSMIEDIVSEFALMSELKGNSNIVSYEDHTVTKKEDGFGWTIYIRMELLTPLFTHIRQKKMTIRDVIQLGIDICTALEVCQKYNIIHRDIKPENIFISNIGTYKLGDFGIARQLEKTSTGLSKKGTIPYMAPEVYKGIGYNSTVDVYSLGLVLYRFLNNNRSPFLPPAPQPIKYSDKQKADIMRMSGQPLPKPCYADGRLAEIVLKACEYNPKHRYETATEMKTALSALIYTETEKSLIYPEGDLLENKSVHYLTERSADISEMVTASQMNVVSPQADVVSSQEEDSGTVYLFQGEKKLQDGTLSVSEPPKVKTQQPNQNQDWEDFAEIGAVAEITETAEAGSVSYDIEKKAEQFNSGYGMKKEVTKRRRAFLRNTSLIVGFYFIVVLAVGILVCMLVSEYVEDYDDLETIETNITEMPTETEATAQSVSDKVLVPDLLNISGEEAKKKAGETKLKIVISEQYSDKVNKGIVLSQEPAKGAEIAMGTTIKVVVSKGVQMVKAPNVLKKSKSKAKALIEKAGLKCKVKTAYSNSYKKGLAMKQSVKQGKQIKLGTTITVTISRGKKAKKSVAKQPAYIPKKRATVKKKTTTKTTKKKTVTGWKKVKPKKEVTGWTKVKSKEEKKGQTTGF